MLLDTEILLFLSLPTLTLDLLSSGSQIMQGEMTTWQKQAQPEFKEATHDSSLS